MSPPTMKTEFPNLDKGDARMPLADEADESQLITPRYHSLACYVMADLSIAAVTHSNVR